MQGLRWSGGFVTLLLVIVRGVCLVWLCQLLVIIHCIHARRVAWFFLCGCSLCTVVFCCAGMQGLRWGGVTVLNGRMGREGGLWLVGF